MSLSTQDFSMPATKPDCHIFNGYIQFWKRSDHCLYVITIRDGRQILLAVDNEPSRGAVAESLLMKFLEEYAVQT